MKSFLQIENLTKSFGDRVLFSDVTFGIYEGDKIGLIAKNGSGKTTLLRIIAGEEPYDSGSLVFRNDLRVGYLKQLPELDPNLSVIEACLSIDDEPTAAIRTYERALASGDADALAKAMSQMDAAGAWDYEDRIRQTLTQLKIIDMNQPVGQLSGGQVKRVALAKVVINEPELLILDEPTNHLDIESIGWLERFLQQNAKAVVLVSHDRAFINNVTNRTIEITCGRVNDYKVKYDEYIKLRDERREQQIRAYENQQKEIADIKDFIERFRYKPTKAVQVQSRIKQLEKIVPIEIDEVDTSAMHLKFPPCLRSGDYPIICEDVRKDYGEHTVFSDVTLTIKRGEKVAFVGKNGEGKSTLVKCIMNEIPFTGNLKVGHNVQIGYFAQNQAQLLDGELTVFETIDNVAKGDIRLKIKNILGSFMFGGEAIDKKVKVLSGGERSRLAMIKLLLEPVNLLILDEPTNHLDIPSKEVLKEAINAFDGTAIIVSHDREFLDGLVTKVYEFGGGKVREHLGGIYDYLRQHNIESLDQLGNNNTSPTSTSTANDVAANAKTEDKPAKQSYAEHKEWQKKIRKAEKSVKESEERIEAMENRLKELDAQLCTPEGASDMKLVTEYAEIKKRMDEEELLWTQLSEDLENLQNQDA